MVDGQVGFEVEDITDLLPGPVEELAELVQATRQTIGLIENGKYNPSLALCLKIAQSLDKTLDQLFWEDQE